MKFYQQELSWLAFNERVLQEAADVSVPVIERMRFLGIFSNNMDEFFQVRVADVRRAIYFAPSSEERDDASQLLTRIQQKVMTLQEQFDRVYAQVLSALADNHVHILDDSQLNDSQRLWLAAYFHDKVKRHVVPLLLNERSDLVQILKQDRIYLFVELNHQQQLSYAAIEVPTDHLHRFVELPRRRGSKVVSVTLLDHVVASHLPDLFAGIVAFDELTYFSFKVTRDADYRVPHDIDQSILERMEEGIKQRFRADPVRLVYDKRMPGRMLRFLCDGLDMDAYDSIVGGGRYRNTRDFAQFQQLGAANLVNPNQLPLQHPGMTKHANVFANIAAADVLLYFPYHSFAAVTEFVRQAAYDPAVTRIAICIYRVARDSRLIHALMDAVRNGKHVTVMVELRARFDEEANIEWSKEMTDAGIRVLFGIQGLKAHAKLLLVQRMEQGQVRRYGYLGTGNFNEKTAEIYTDFGLFTAHPTICHEIEQVFHYLEQPYRRYDFHELLVSPVNTRERLEAAIDAEISAAQHGQPAEIFIKVNNLVDEALIVRLYRASRAGVRIRALVRGMCALRAGVPGLSELIEVRSIVDRLLEHARVFMFHNGGQQRIYISSADWMKRNIDRRVEASCPIYDEQARATIESIMELQWHDNCKARVIDAEQSNAYVTPKKRKVRAQKAIYSLLKRQLTESKS
ncbi:MAG: Polyphosphate kinase [Pseudidiomarina mangrovi]|nr:MAG: Polyphosphate kinase [Pseudidiomarina mangrovi]